MATVCGTALQGCCECSKPVGAARPSAGGCAWGWLVRCWPGWGASACQGLKLPGRPRAPWDPWQDAGIWSFPWENRLKARKQVQSRFPSEPGNLRLVFHGTSPESGQEGSPGSRTAAGSGRLTAPTPFSVSRCRGSGPDARSRSAATPTTSPEVLAPAAPRRAAGAGRQGPLPPSGVSTAAGHPHPAARLLPEPGSGGTPGAHPPLRPAPPHRPRAAAWRGGGCRGRLLGAAAAREGGYVRGKGGGGRRRSRTLRRAAAAGSRERGGRMCEVGTRPPLAAERGEPPGGAAASERCRDMG